MQYLKIRLWARDFYRVIAGEGDSRFIIIYGITTVFVDTRLRNQNTRETFPKFPSILRVIVMSDRNPPITARYHDVEKVRRSH